MNILLSCFAYTCGLYKYKITRPHRDFLVTVFRAGLSCVGTANGCILFTSMIQDHDSLINRYVSFIVEFVR